MGLKTFWVKKNVRSEKILVPKKYCVKKNVGFQKEMSLNKFWVRKISKSKKNGFEKFLAPFLRNRVKGGEGRR